jgi:uncharacterized membrane protein YdjX (TVP38/TMEM64 family)
MSVFILLTLWCHGPLSPFLPAAYEPLLLFYGQLYPPLVVALVGALASVAAEYVNYHMYRVLLGHASIERRVMSNAASRAVSALFARCPFLAVWICAWSPLPDWAARVLASHARYSIRRYLAAVLAGRIPKFWFLAAVGMHWAPPGATIAAIVVGSVVLTLGGIFLRRPASRSQLAPSRAVLLIIIGIGVGITTPAAAQQSLGVGPVMGASFDRFGSPGEGPVAFTFRRSRLTGAGPAEDLALRLFPSALPEGVAVIGADVGVMQAVALGPVALFVKGGASVIAELGLHGADLIPGLEGGIGTLVRLQHRAALRVDVTRHSFYSDGEHYGVWSFGLGLSVLPPAAENRPR